MLYAIIDIGSNTIRMAIYNITVNGDKEQVEMLYKDKRMIGLAGFVENNIMGRDGIEQVCHVIKNFKSFLEKLSINHVTAFTTAALRNCLNSREAVAEIRQCSGIDVKVVSGDEEAELDFIGATHGQEKATGILVDIGGGSTELVHFADGHIVKKISLPIGSLDYRKKHVSGILPTQQEIEIMRQKTKDILYLNAKKFKSIQFDEMKGIGGTLKGTWMLYNQIMKKNHESEGTFEAKYLDLFLDRFQQGKVKEDDTLILLRAIPERLETVMPGMVIASVLADVFGSKYITYSDTGMREGFIYREIIPALS